jgi:hypothetical protein
VYYFNSKLNFYEPLIEKTKIDILFVNREQTNNKHLIIKNQDTFNVNLSVALYETLFILSDNLE